MRIVHVSDCYVPRTGGIETQVYGLAHAQAARGDTVHVITATRDAEGTGDSNSSVTVHRATMRVPFDLPIHLRPRPHIVNVLQNNKPDVVHVHAGVVSPFAWSGIAAAGSLNLPVLVTIHSMWTPWVQRVFASARTLVRVDGRVAWSSVSRAAARRVERALGGPVLVVPNGIAAADWVVSHEPGVPNVLSVATVMRFAPPKRVLPLLGMLGEAQRVLRGDGVTLRAVIVGDGPERTRAERFLVRHGIEDIVLAGRRSHDEIRALFARTDVYVQPSVSEAFGLAALEARVSGLPVVARAESGAAEFITSGINGLLVEDDAALVSGLVALGRHPEERRRLADHNRSAPIDHDWSRVLSQHDAAYATARRGR